MNKESFYITTSIFYPNAAPHIGHVLEMVQGDVLARYHRMQDKEVFFLTGTDEHGSKIVRSAAQHKKDPQEWVDENTARFEEIMKALGISYDNFIRTSDSETHWPVAQEVWKRLVAKGDIYKKEYDGLYCVGHEAFVTEQDLVEGKCPEHGTEPEHVSEENYFFALSRYTDVIREQIEAGIFSIVPESRKNELLQLLERGLEDVSFSRPQEKLSGWGVPVPDDPSHLMYVWVDALSNYLSGIGYFSDKETAAYWPADVHVIGKDILRFHAAIWPAILLSAEIPLPKTILVHGHIVSGGTKMSKTLGNVIDPFDLVASFGAEAVRYYVAAEIPTTEDGDFTHERFVARYNGDLADGLGNLTARVLALAAGETFASQEGDLAKDIKATWSAYRVAFDEYNLKKAAESVWALIHTMDGYIEKKKPWEKGHTKQEREAMLSTLLTSLAHIAWLIRPFLPETSDKIFVGLGTAPDAKEWQFAPQKIDPLFPKKEV